MALPKTNTPMNSNLCEKERPEIGRTISIKKLSGNFKIGNRNGLKAQTLHFVTKFELGYYLFCLNATKECTLLFATRFSTSFSHSHFENDYYIPGLQSLGQKSQPCSKRKNFKISWSLPHSFTIWILSGSLFWAKKINLKRDIMQLFRADDWGADTM